MSNQLTSNSTNRTSAEGAVPRNGIDSPGADEIVLDLDDEGIAAQADVAWIDDEFNKGNFANYRGEYIAVVGKRVLGHDKSLWALRENVARTMGFPLGRIVTSFIDHPVH